jgi:hypothetical protein
MISTLHFSITTILSTQSFSCMHIIRNISGDFTCSLTNFDWSI